MLKRYQKKPYKACTSIEGLLLIIFLHRYHFNKYQKFARSYEYMYVILNGVFFLRIEINTGKQTKYQRKSYRLCSEKLE